MEKLQIATKKLENPTSTGILRLRRKGAKTGSGETKNSTKKKTTANVAAEEIEIITYGFDH